MPTYCPSATRGKSEAGRGLGVQARAREHRDAAVLLADQEFDLCAAEDDALRDEFKQDTARLVRESRRVLRGCRAVPGRPERDRVPLPPAGRVPVQSVYDSHAMWRAML